MSTAITKRKMTKNNNVLDRIYYSMPVEVWLSLAIVGASADLIFNYGTTAIVTAAALVIVLGIYLVYSNEAVANICNKFVKTIQAPKNVIPLLLVSTILGTALMVFTIHDSAQALIITASGLSAFKGLISGQTFTGAAVQVGGSVGSTTASSNAAGLVGFADGVVVLIKVIFALAFLFGLKNAYDKYKERAELTEIVQGPAVLIFVVVAIDAIMNLIFGPA
jgi:hypothetical protein